MDAIGYSDPGYGGVDHYLRQSGDERFLGRWIADVVGSGEGEVESHSAVGDLSGQWPQELGAANTVFEADDRIRGLVGFGDPVGVLSAVPQQIQSD